jgi:hypothetical protein
VIVDLVAFVSNPQTNAQEGTDVILIMLITGLVFLAVIGLGELTRWAGHRRQERKQSARPY